MGETQMNLQVAVLKKKNNAGMDIALMSSSEVDVALTSQVLPFW
jgi:hypothetical protein